MSETTKPKIVDRKAVLNDFRRELIRDAAKSVFARVGLQGTSVREIARAAGCTTGAIYSQYTGKKEVYAEILRESLIDMAEAVEAGARGGPPGRRGCAALRAWYEYFRDQPVEFDLGFYLYGGAHPAGVGKELNEELNTRLKRVYAAVAEGLEADGLAGRDSKHQQSVAFASWIFGILLMKQTGRLRILAIDPEKLVDDCLDRVSRSP